MTAMERTVGPTVSTKYWHRLADDRVQCDVCPRFCTLREGQQGLCFVRAREGGEVVLTTYGRSSGFCVDPIEKKPLNHFLPGTSVLSFGTEGCNLSCKFCQNWDISKSREIAKLADEASPELIARAAKSLGCRASRSRTTIRRSSSSTRSTSRRPAARSASARSPSRPATSAKKPREDFYEHIDAANVDLKAFTEKFYWEVTGAHLQPVLDTLVYLKKKTNVWLEITNLVIPGHNDSDEEIGEMSRWVVENLGPDVPMHFTAFHPDWKMLDVPPTPPATLSQRATDRAESRRALRLHGQHRRRGGRQHLLPPLRRGAHRPRRIRADRSGLSRRARARSAASRAPDSSRNDPGSGGRGACRFA